MRRNMTPKRSCPIYNWKPCFYRLCRGKFWMIDWWRRKTCCISKRLDLVRRARNAVVFNLIRIRTNMSEKTSLCIMNLVLVLSPLPRRLISSVIRLVDLLSMLGIYSIRWNAIYSFCIITAWEMKKNIYGLYEMRIEWSPLVNRAHA